MLALGFAVQFFSDALIDQTVETVLEAAYSFNVTTWLTITPDIQYIIRPSGMQSIDNALLAGVLVYLTFCAQEPMGQRPCGVDGRLFVCASFVARGGVT